MLVAHFERIVVINPRNQIPENNFAAPIFRPNDVSFLMIIKTRFVRNFAGFGVLNGFENAVVVIDFAHRYLTQSREAAKPQRNNYKKRCGSAPSRFYVEKSLLFIVISRGDFAHFTAYQIVGKTLPQKIVVKFLGVFARFRFAFEA